MPDEDAAERTMHIGELADRAGMSQPTLRHYDEVGLLRPSARSEGGFRLYTEADLERLLVIRRMKPLGFSLDEMAQVLEIVDGLGVASSSAGRAELRARRDAFVAAAQERREALATRLAMADEFIALLRDR